MTGLLTAAIINNLYWRGDGILLDAMMKDVMCSVWIVSDGRNLLNESPLQLVHDDVVVCLKQFWCLCKGTAPSSYRCHGWLAVGMVWFPRQLSTVGAI